MISALAERRGRFRLDLLRNPTDIPGLGDKVESTLALVGLTGRADTPVSALAYGEKRRLEIGLALATSPSLLLLDEPLAGMSPRERAETVKLLKSISQGRTTIIIDHDMDALFEMVGAGDGSAARAGFWSREPRTKSRPMPSVREAYLGGVLDE